MIRTYHKDYRAKIKAAGVDGDVRLRAIDTALDALAAALGDGATRIHLAAQVGDCTIARIATPNEESLNITNAPFWLSVTRPIGPNK